MKYAPADTEKRPLINEKKRNKLKIISSIKGILYLVLIIYFKDNPISGYLLCGLIESVLMIHPFVYKIFNLSYDNYKNYNCGV
jgi:accessory gene regulator B